MKHLILLLVLLGLAAWASPGAAQQRTDSCRTCHLETGDERLAKPAKDFPGDIHASKGFDCVACHGGDAKAAGMEAMDPAKGYIGKPERQQVAQVCGRCHSDARFMKRYNPALRVDQVAEYATSVHGRRLRELGDPKVATCMNCHPAHSIKPPSDPQSSVHPLKVAETCGRCHADAKYMEPYKIPTNQLAKYKQSVHWQTMSVKGDLSAPTCNDCHGNHGAAPPGISWVGNVCGQCHSVQGEFFAKSVHAKLFVEMGAPGCAACHSNHEIKESGDAMLGLGDKAVCAGCHSAGDKGGKAAAGMRALVDSLAGAWDRSHAMLLQAERAGMEVSQAQFDLNGAKDALVKARAAIHAFSVQTVKEESEPGLAISAKAYARGVKALDEIQFRRKGLAVSLVIILALIAGLGLKIRELDRRGSAILLAAGLWAAAPGFGIGGAAERAGDPARGSAVFKEKQCARCHLPRGQGPGMGPPLEAIRQPQGALRLVGRLWNHAPVMFSAFEKEGLTWPEIPQERMADLMAYLQASPSRDPAPDLFQGQVLLIRKGCLKCHRLRGEGGSVGIELTKYHGGYDSPVAWATTIWNHSPRMAGHAARLGVLYPRFTGDEMVNLFGFLKSAAAVSPQ